MGMAVKGTTEHRLVRAGMVALQRYSGWGYDAPERDAIERLIRRADLAIARIKQRKQKRAERA